MYLNLKHHDEGGAVAALSDHPFPLMVNLVCNEKSSNDFW